MKTELLLFGALYNVLYDLKVDLTQYFTQEQREQIIKIFEDNGMVEDLPTDKLIVLFKEYGDKVLNGDSV